VNILHFIASPSPGGIETYVRDLAVEIAADRHLVHICFLESASEAGTCEEYEQEYLSTLESAGVQYSFIGQDARRRPWRGIRKMRKFTQKHSIDVYHSHLTYGVVFGSMVGIPRVYTHHSIEMRVGRLAFAMMNRIIDQLVAISDECASVLSRHTVREVVTIFNAVDLKKLTKEGIATRELAEIICCISVGRICAEKNYELLIEAIACLPQNLVSRLSVQIAGAGSEALTNQLRNVITQKKLEDVVRLLGSRSDVPSLLASSHLFLMSSSIEGLPIALIEAAVSGLPCVVTDVGGCREVIQKCGNGVVVEPNNAQALADAIERLINDRAKFSMYSVNALKNAKQFSIKRATAAHKILYRRLLASAGQEA